MLGHTLEDGRRVGVVPTPARCSSAPGCKRFAAPTVTPSRSLDGRSSRRRRRRSGAASRARPGQRRGCRCSGPGAPCRLVAAGSRLWQQELLVTVELQPVAAEKVEGSTGLGARLRQSVHGTEPIRDHLLTVAKGWRPSMLAQRRLGRQFVVGRRQQSDQGPP
jgi:hypothetical protein